jgi:small-conductance mechanosensitive channel
MAGVSGLVESVSLRKTVLRDLQGKVHTIPNGEIKIVSNLSKEWSRSVLDIAISYREDVDRVIDVLSQIGRELESEEPYQSAILEPAQILGVDWNLALEKQITNVNRILYGKTLAYSVCHTGGHPLCEDGGVGRCCRNPA